MRMKNFIAVMGAVAIMISGGVPPLNLYASEAAVVPAPAEQQLVIDYTTYVDQVASLVETEDQKRYRSLCPAFEAGERITLKSSEDRGKQSKKDDCFLFCVYNGWLDKEKAKRYVNESDQHRENHQVIYRSQVI